MPLARDGSTVEGQNALFEYLLKVVKKPLLIPVSKELHTEQRRDILAITSYLRERG